MEIILWCINKKDFVVLVYHKLKLKHLLLQFFVRWAICSARNTDKTQHIEQIFKTEVQIHSLCRANAMESAVLSPGVISVICCYQLINTTSRSVFRSHCFLITSFHAKAYRERCPVYFFRKRTPNSRWWPIHTVCKKLSSTKNPGAGGLTLSWKYRQDLYLQTNMSFSDSQPYHYYCHWNISTLLTSHHASRLYWKMINKMRVNLINLICG